MDPIGVFCQQNGLPEAVAAAWRARGIAQWTPLQEAAWAAGVQHGREHWLAAGPTSAGKGLLAEAAAACTLARGRKVLWLAPTRALAATAASQLAGSLAGLGVRVRCATRDTAAEDAAIFRGRFELLVAVYEKAAAWLARQPHGLAEVELVVADELTMLRDPERGARLDILLTLLATSPYAPRRLGLTLPAPGLEALAAWWGGRLLVCGERPRPLHEGVLEIETGRWRWRDRQDGREGGEILETRRGIAHWLAQARREMDETDCPPLRTATAAVAAGLAGRGEPTLLFASSRPLARWWAGALAEAFTLPSPPDEVVARARALAAREPSSDHHLLARALERGVGLHHADLPAEGRRLVEEAFREGAIRLLVATPTLAQGVNLAAANVLHWPERPETGGPGLERWRFADQGGRAGRLGLGEGPGRSILVAWDARQAEALWRRYIVEPAEPVASGLAEGGLAPALLACLAGEVTRTRENIRRFFSGTLAGATTWRERPEELDAGLDRALELCRGVELVTDAPNHTLRLTGLGQTCAAQGLMPETAARLRPWLEAEGGMALTAAEPPLGALCALALSAPPGLWPGWVRPWRSAAAGELRRWFEMRELGLPGPLAALLEQPGGPGTAELAALEASLRLAQWIGPEPTEQVERRTGWPAGSLARAGEGLAWVAGGAAAISLARGGRPEAAEDWRTLGVRLAAGVAREGAAAAALNVEGLGRGAIQALGREGLSTTQALAEAAPALLARLLGDKALARRVRAAARRMRNAECGLRNGQMLNVQRPMMDVQSDALDVRRKESREEWAATPVPSDSGKSTTPNSQLTTHIAQHPSDIGHLTFDPFPLLEIDLTSPGVVKVAGQEVRLTPLTFDLLAALAESPGRVLTRQAIYQRLWPEGDGPEDQQLDAHRRRLAGELGTALGGAAGRLIETIRGVGFRLNMPAPQVQLVRG